MLDPCEDENNDNQDDVSLGADSLQIDGDSESDSDVICDNTFFSSLCT